MEETLDEIVELYFDGYELEEILKVMEVERCLHHLAKIVNTEV